MLYPTTASIRNTLIFHNSVVVAELEHPVYGTATTACWEHNDKLVA
jgi:hypothetical protein